MKEEIRGTLARNMRRYRAISGMSQETLAERSGLHRTYISDIERRARNVGIDNVGHIAAALQVSAADLFARPDDKGEEYEQAP